MKTKKQVKRKLIALIDKRKSVRTYLDVSSRLDMKARQRGENIEYERQENKLSGEINSLNWVLK